MSLFVCVPCMRACLCVCVCVCVCVKTAALCPLKATPHSPQCPLKSESLVRPNIRTHAPNLFCLISYTFQTLDLPVTADLSYCIVK